MQKAIIDTATSVILRLTLDENPVIAIHESIVEVPNNITLDSPKKIDSEGKVVTASIKEYENADPEVKAEKNQKKINDLISDMAVNGVDFDKLQQYFQFLKG